MYLPRQLTDSRFVGCMRLVPNIPMIGIFINEENDELLTKFMLKRKKSKDGDVVLPSLVQSPGRKRRRPMKKPTWSRSPLHM
jgi:hypothetical protein